MTPKQINYVVAMKRGWKREWSDTAYGYLWYSPNGNMSNGGPDYCHDLNVLREVEMSLDGDTHAAYVAWIYKVVGVEPDTIFADDMRKVVCASAAERCEALLKMWGLWEVETDQSNNDKWAAGLQIVNASDL
jgi:hypothetical protein